MKKLIGVLITMLAIQFGYAGYTNEIEYPVITTTDMYKTNVVTEEVYGGITYSTNYDRLEWIEYIQFPTNKNGVYLQPRYSGTNKYTQEYHIDFTSRYQSVNQPLCCTNDRLWHNTNRLISWYSKANTYGNNQFFDRNHNPTPNWNGVLIINHMNIFQYWVNTNYIRVTNLTGNIGIIFTGPANIQINTNNYFILPTKFTMEISNQVDTLPQLLSIRHLVNAEIYTNINKITQSSLNPPTEKILITTNVDIHNLPTNYFKFYQISTNYITNLTSRWPTNGIVETNIYNNETNWAKSWPMYYTNIYTYNLISSIILYQTNVVSGVYLNWLISNNKNISETNCTTNVLVYLWGVFTTITTNYSYYTSTTNYSYYLTGYKYYRTNYTFWGDTNYNYRIFDNTELKMLWPYKVSTSFGKYWSIQPFDILTSTNLINWDTNKINFDMSYDTNGTATLTNWYYNSYNLKYYDSNFIVSTNKPQQQYYRFQIKSYNGY